MSNFNQYCISFKYLKIFKTGGINKLKYLSAHAGAVVYSNFMHKNTFMIGPFWKTSYLHSVCVELR